jgi:four helix bundle protein
MNDNTSVSGSGTKVGNGRIKGDLRLRTKQFALKIVVFYSDLPRRREAQIIGDQLLRSGTSVGAHFREAQRAKSIRDFISKLEGALQELDETAYWLELLEEASLISSDKVDLLKTEADELIAIFVTIVRKTKLQAKN